MKTPANLDAPPLGWQGWPTAAQIEEHGYDGVWLARPPFEVLRHRWNKQPIVGGTFNRARIFDSGSGRDDYFVEPGDDDGWAFCPIDEWGRTVLLKSATPTAAAGDGGTK